jgi:hypothetical protein
MASVIDCAFASAEGVARVNELEHATLSRVLIGTLVWPIAKAVEERASYGDEVRNSNDLEQTSGICAPYVAKLLHDLIV